MRSLVRCQHVYSLVTKKNAMGHESDAKTPKCIAGSQGKQ